nr:hypothetical protein [uncultured Flavobacterium sp.]
MKKILLTFFTLFSFLIHGQELIQGKLLLEDYTTIKLSVFNKNSNETVETNVRGIFKMNMNENDTLVFFQNETIFDEFIVPESVIRSKALRYILKKEGATLKELVIDRGPLLSFGGKPKNREEKKEHQNSIKPVFNNSIGLSLDGMFNRIFGKNKDIKRVVELEKVQRNFDTFKEIYTDKILIEEIEIPKDYVNLFVYYLVDENDFNKDLISISDEYKIYLVSKVLKFKKEYEL